jgi:hypothetical protein
MAPRPHFASDGNRPGRFLVVLVLAILLVFAAGQLLYLVAQSSPSDVGVEGSPPTATPTESTG